MIENWPSISNLIFCNSKVKKQDNLFQNYFYLGSFSIFVEVKFILKNTKYSKSTKTCIIYAKLFAESDSGVKWAKITTISRTDGWSIGVN